MTTPAPDLPVHPAPGDVLLAAASDMRADSVRSMRALATRLYPILRSITGPGVRETLRLLSDIVPISVTEVPTGTPVFDWTIPDEWHADEAWIEDPEGRRIVDLREHTLHLVSYSVPVDVRLPLAELRAHLHSMPEKPDWIPYRTAYYSPNWGFCVPHRLVESLRDGTYRAVVRSSLRPGALSLGEYVHTGETTEEVFIFAHCCHPSLANDNLAGLAVATHLAAFLRGRRTRYTYRFVFAPATIGSIAWLALNRERWASIRHGLVLALLGVPAPLAYKPTRDGNCTIDRIARHVLATEYRDARVREFSPWGYDERQYASPGVNLPIGSLTRSGPGEFPEYHTSADDLALLNDDALGESWLACVSIVSALENDATYENLSPCGEPQLGRRGLYRATGGHTSVADRQLALLWVLNQSDGSKSLLEVAERSKLPMPTIAAAARDLADVGLLRRTDGAK